MADSKERLPDPAGREHAVKEGARGGPGVPPRSERGLRPRDARSGCPDLNWGPLRPERSALPGCATPRVSKVSGSPRETTRSHPRRRRAFRRSAGARSRRSAAAARAAAVRTRTRRRRGAGCPARPRARATGQRTRSRSARGSSRVSACAALTVSVWRAGPARKPSTTSAGSAWRVRGAPAPEDERPQHRRAGHPAPMRRDPPARLERSRDRERVARPASARRDARRARENDASDELGPADRQAQRDRTAERVPDDRRRGDALVLQDERQPVRVGVQSWCRRERLGASVSGKLGHEQPPSRKQQRREG